MPSPAGILSDYVWFGLNIFCCRETGTEAAAACIGPLTALCSPQPMLHFAGLTVLFIIVHCTCSLIHLQVAVLHDLLSFPGYHYIGVWSHRRLHAQLFKYATDLFKAVEHTWILKNKDWFFNITQLRDENGEFPSYFDLVPAEGRFTLARGILKSVPYTTEHLCASQKGHF